MIKILVIPSDRSGVGHFRSINPHVKMQENYPDDVFVEINYNPNLKNIEYLKQFDIVHYHKMLLDYSKTKENLDIFKSLNIKTVLDIDDYWDVDVNHPAYITIKKHNIDKYISENIKYADYVTTTTKYLANEISIRNKNVHVFPNAIEPTDKQFIPNPTKSDRLRLGLLWGSSHKQDINLLKDLTTSLINEKLIDKIQFVLCGFDTRGVYTNIDPKTNKVTQQKMLPEQTVWYYYEKLLTNNHTVLSDDYKKFLHKFIKDEYPNVENEPYRRIWTKSSNTYATGYNEFDVMLAPLNNTKFNKLKSELKFVESGNFSKPFICSKIEPYLISGVDMYERGGTFNDNGNLLYVPQDKDKFWIKHIKNLINNPELINTLGNNIHKTFNEKYHIDVVVKNRYEFYKKIKNGEI